MVKRIIEYLPILTVIFVYFGYCNIYFYYHLFGINIYNYISTTEIILSFVPTIFLVMLSFAAAPLGFLYGLTRRKNIESSDDTQKQRKLKKVQIFLGISTIVSITSYAILRYWLLSKLGHKEFEYKYEFAQLNLVLFSLALATLASVIDPDKNTKYYYIYLTALLIIVGLDIRYYKSWEAEEIKEKGNKMNIAFRYNGITIRTDSIKTLIGETQEDVFLYNRKDSSTIIFSKKNLDSIVFKATN